MKAGIDYFPLDCQLDEKFELIEAEFGLTGFSVVVKLLQRIYGGQGYYCEWTREVALLFARRAGLAGGNAVSEIVSAAIERGIFDRVLYERYSILTSSGIQRRYLEAVGRRKKVTLKSEYLLLCYADLPKNVDISGENANISKKNANISEQSRVEESKVEESRVEESTAAPCGASPYVAHDLYHNIQLSENEYESLCGQFGKHNTDRYIKRMSTYQFEKSRSYSSHFKKLTEWMRKDGVKASSYDLDEIKSLKNQF